MTFSAKRCPLKLSEILSFIYKHHTHKSLEYILLIALCFREKQITGYEEVPKFSLHSQEEMLCLLLRHVQYEKLTQESTF